jgi:hypothetical protein
MKFLLEYDNPDEIRHAVHLGVMDGRPKGESLNLTRGESVGTHLNIKSR